jgi:hypothetical protein
VKKAGARVEARLNAGLRLVEADSAHDALVEFLENRLLAARVFDGKAPPWEVVQSNGTCLATYKDGRRFAAVPVD